MPNGAIDSNVRTYIMYHIDLNFFAVLNFRGFGGSTAIHESLVLQKFRPALTEQ